MTSGNLISEVEEQRSQLQNYIDDNDSVMVNHATLYLEAREEQLRVARSNLEGFEDRMSQLRRIVGEVTEERSRVQTLFKQLLDLRQGSVGHSRPLATQFFELVQRMHHRFHELGNCIESSTGRRL